ncbi:hypothetical protein ACIGFK_13360 [Streptomyces sp. NPDC085524]|uniref:hypothetical protein n=1 Tax=Streptomyces sp. NPDC085524 TaxID=3365728 RepID=UPI0037CFCBFB
MAISVGSVEVDVIPNTQGIYARLHAGLVPAAEQVGDDMGRVIGRRLEARIAPAIRDAIEGGARAARPSATRQGDETGGAFSRSLKTRLEAAFRSLPKIRIDADTSEADSDLQALRVRMESLANKRIGIDIDAGAARAEVRLIEAELRRLGAEHPNVQVRADTAAARAQLALVHAEIDAVDGKRARIDVDTSGALSAILQLTVAIGGVAALPAIPILAAGVGAIGSAAVASAAGVGALAAVAAPAFINIAGALQAQKAAQDASTAASGRGAQAGAQAASRALQMAGAQQSLASAQRNAAAQIASAHDQVRQAARGVGDAERQLADAQKASAKAQEDLTQARKEAAQQLEDLSTRYADAQLSVRDAELSLAEAQQRRSEVEGDPKATALEKERAALAVAQATQRLKQQTVETKRLAEEQAEAGKTGIEGTQVVKQAQDRLAQSQQTVADRTRGVADAQAAVAKAQENVARVSAQAADSIASAQRQIASASASAAGGVDQAALAQANYQAALDKLTPSARGTFDAFQSLRTAFKGWSESLQPAVMPIFTRALDGIRNSLPGLTPFVLAAAEAIGILQDKVSAGFKSPWWKSFRDDLAASVLPATVGLGVALGNVFKTLAGIVDAFLPHMDSISERMQQITGRWARWATGLKGSDKFEGFLSYASTMGPVVAQAIGDIAGAFLAVGKALQPISGPLLNVLGALFSGITWIATEFPGAIQLLYGIFIATRLWAIGILLVQGAMWLANAAVAAFNFVMAAGPWGWIIIAIVAVVAAVVFMYNRFDWFRNFIDGVWQAIKTGAVWLWENVLKPVFSAIWTALQFLGSVAMWLWTNAIKPAFEGIWLAARVLFAILVTVVIVPLVLAFKGLAAIVTWLWENIFAPAFRGIADVAIWLWQNVLSPIFSYIGDKAVGLWRDYISPAWDSTKRGTRSLGDGFRELWTSYIKPVFEYIGDKAAWLYDNAIRPAFDKMKTAVGLVKDAFNLAKDGIKTAWDQLVDITRKPVQFVVDTVYNGGIVPVWNKVAKIAGLSQLEPYKFASGGSVFGAGTATSDSIPALLSNGEHVWTAREVQAAGGHSVVESLRSRALQSGSTFATGGAVGIPRFADGGIVDWLSGKAQQIGSAVMSAFDVVSNPGKAWDTATQGLRDKISEKLTGNQWAQALSQLPLRMLKGLKDKVISGVESLIGGGNASGSVAAAMGFARSQAGKPYQWGGAGDPSWDCSGFMSGIQKVILGQSPLGRLWSTFSFQGDTAPAGWRRGLRSPFMIGITNAGVGHTAGTLAGMNVESRGGAGVVVGSRARGYNDSLFTDWYGFAPALGKFDSGGYLQPGMNLAYNGTGRPEPVLTTAQWNTLAASGSRQPAADQRSYQITLQGSHLTKAEQAAELVRQMAFTT